MVEMSTQQHAHQHVPKHAIQLTKTSVAVVWTVSRRIDPEQTELEDDSMPRPVTSGAQRGANHNRALSRQCWVKLTHPSIFGGLTIASVG